MSYAITNTRERLRALAVGPRGNKTQNISTKRGSEISVRFEATSDDWQKLANDIFATVGTSPPPSDFVLRVFSGHTVTFQMNSSTGTYEVVSVVDPKTGLSTTQFSDPTLHLKFMLPTAEKDDSWVPRFLVNTTEGSEEVDTTTRTTNEGKVIAVILWNAAVLEFTKLCDAWRGFGNLVRENFRTKATYDFKEALRQQNGENLWQMYYLNNDNNDNDYRTRLEGLAAATN